MGPPDQQASALPTELLGLYHHMTNPVYLHIFCPLLQGTILPVLSLKVNDNSCSGAICHFDSVFNGDQLLKREEFSPLGENSFS